MKKNRKPKQIERGIRLAWSSLDSHLRYTYLKSWEKEAFHKRCVVEYAELIKILASLY